MSCSDAPNTGALVRMSTQPWAQACRVDPSPAVKAMTASSANLVFFMIPSSLFGAKPGLRASPAPALGNQPAGPKAAPRAGSNALIYKGVRGGGGIGVGSAGFVASRSGFLRGYADREWRA